MASVGQALREAAGQLAGDGARLEAEILLGAALRRDRAWLFAHAHDPLDEQASCRFRQLLELRRLGQPIAYLTGIREFWSLPLRVSADTLVPRPETERLVELALQRLPVDAATDILDLGTGSGAIALALASERRHSRITAVDASPRALAIAQGNASRLGLGNIECLRSDWFSALAGQRYGLVASNPPYIAEDDPHLLQGDLPHEPRMALASGVDGLDALRRIVSGAPGHLSPGGWLLVEHGREQGSAVRGLFGTAGFVAVETALDLEGRERVTLGQWPGTQGPGTTFSI